MTRKILQSPGLASALLLALAVATAPPARACKNDKTASSSPCSTPSSSELDMSAMAASTGAVSIPDFGTECTTRTPAVPFASYSGSSPAVRHAAPHVASKTSTAAAATHVVHEAPHAEEHVATKAASKHASDATASRPSTSAPKGPEAYVVSRPHRMPSPEIF